MPVLPPTPKTSTFFGFVFDLLLFGILTAQAYIYYISFPRDRTLLKIAVVWVYLAGVAQTGLVLLDFLTWGDWQEVEDPAITKVVVFRTDHFSITITTLTAAVAIVIQSLYAYRIYLISQKRWLAIMIICMSLGQLASGILGAICYAPVTAGTVVMLFNVWLKIRHVCHIGFDWSWGPLNIICDLAITISMVTFLIRYRRRTIRNQTRSHITKVVQVVVETGMATTILMVVYTVLLLLGPFNPSYWWYTFPGLTMSKVYSNSMLVLLNNRATIVNGRNAVESFEFVEVSGRGLEGDISLRTRGRNSAGNTPAQS